MYGLGANALDPSAVERIYVAKGRPAYNPLIVHVADVAAARNLVREWPDVSREIGCSVLAWAVDARASEAADDSGRSDREAVVRGRPGSGPSCRPRAC